MRLLPAGRDFSSGSELELSLLLVVKKYISGIIKEVVQTNNIVIIRLEARCYDDDVNNIYQRN